MKKIGLLTIALVSISFVYGQENWCGTDQKMENIFLQNPELRQQVHEHIMRNASGLVSYNDRGINGTIPVVVHIIHEGGEGNISYDQILDGLNILNLDYQRLNADTIATRNTVDAPFWPVSANIGLTFELAKLDPGGNCTNGVERVFSSELTNNATDDCKYSVNGGLDGWPNNEYLNIWVVNSIESGGAGTTLGYASLPYFGAGDDHGIVIRHDAFGTIGTSNSDGETLTHEVGHVLGLLHTFQEPFFGGGSSGCHSDDCSNNGDYMCDTPPVDVATWGCSGTQNSCADIPTGDFYGFDAFDQYENWMSYDACQSMFSEDQKAIILTNLTDIAFMSNWITSGNNASTGVGLPEVLCVAEFTSSGTVICAGDSVQYFDGSYFGVTGITWTFPGGSPSTSTSSNPVIIYDTPGVYSVTLDVTDGTSNESITETNYILVLSSPGDPAPYFEGFELMTALTDNNRFVVMNENGIAGWEHFDGIGIQGSKCAWLNNYGNSDGTIDELMSSSIDLSSVDPTDALVFTFQYAYKKAASGDTEKLKFYVSNDCGQTWALRKSLQGNVFTTEVQSTAYTTVPDADWTFVTVTNINSVYFTENFRFKFVFTNDGGGNNLYLDDINLYPASMTNLIGNPDYQNTLSIYPNPTTNDITIELIGQQGKDYTVELYSPLGAKIDIIYHGQLSNGLNQLNYSTANLPVGIYIVKVSNEDRIQTIKLIKE